MAGASPATAFLLIGLLLFLSACSFGGPTTSTTPTPIPTRLAPGPLKHIIFFIKENRTFDNYFGTYPGANGATMALDSQGKMTSLAHQHDQVPDIDHSAEGARMAYDNGKMDHFDLLHSKAGKNSSVFGCGSIGRCD